VLPAAGADSALLHHLWLIGISRNSCRATWLRQQQGLEWQRLIPVLESLLTSARHTEFLDQTQGEYSSVAGVPVLQQSNLNQR
jgi:hypothetical protein